ncbi:MAG: PQQ-dependent sugar dehydrogenase, partial [Anaerolineales bacterium]|nr:PQQ-dependent sugar dehydrogenase [Anaerolineales bacterium]
GSGTLWALDPAQLDSPTVLATGLKNAYAHVFDANGRLWITEIGDGSVTGADFEGQPPEELNLVIPGADYGWPQCFGDQEPALNRDGTPEVCARTQPPAALFNPQSTPTGIAISPWDEDVLLVARWLGQEVTAVAIHMENGRIVGETRPFIVGFGNPQHLLALPDQTLLVSDYREGVIYKVEQEQ